MHSIVPKVLAKSQRAKMLPDATIIGQVEIGAAAPARRRS
jgi:carbonic anhydrase/acetyltransferase-like protein (isoleucine patch superfamily)